MTLHFFKIVVAKTKIIKMADSHLETFKVKALGNKTPTKVSITGTE